ncbi:TIGR03013 family XrtA/PEP-CTERM system glycosyltransferase [Sphingomonas jeddahensis]|uniref:UDP-N-acetylgalactosamine-undecaprenyl-phosphate N-acetylgalactosaminephosphotransferase n=1 Tax=Sphingomonas jeddahensis TaxID=1915074 RepID=A0A1V2ETB2_9SPHN|nr:TIGR03013 family XrtA/PEP-CTERM system glycosyltransferase [Sphingomonas jeddahensis]ONF95840.1 UDP-N-acetylgalactosamine-undecaprenyl-phosphate N-acetylgalactosaminephosphotransferase [Sphingomonas jeddahensis]
MIRIFKHYVPNAVALLGLIDVVILLVAAELGWQLRAWQIDMAPEPIWTRLPQLATFAVPLEIAMVAVGAYQADVLVSVRQAVMRLMVAVSLGVIFLSLLFFFFPSVTFWRSSLFYAMLFSIVGLVAVRLLFGRMLGGERFRRRIIVLGAGSRAARLGTLERANGASFLIAGYVAMGEPAIAVDGAVARADIPNLAAFVVEREALEVVLAIEERRNALPLKDLLRIKTTGVHVSEYSTFLERETGRIDLASVNPSWLIFSDGFASGRMLSAIAKRGFDIVVSAALLLVAAPVIALTAIAIKLESRGPAFYRQRRVGLYNEPFDIPKLRSMRQDAEVAGQAVWAAERDPRITRIGRFIRKVRIDELPQCWSVLKGEMSFVGPRPERPQFVTELEQHLPYYAERHMVKPGITGWAQINYPYGASIEDARHKLEYDLYYAKNYSPFLDLLILLQTLRVVLWPSGAR